MNLINGVRTPCEQARVEAGDDPELQTGIHQDLAWVAFYLGDLDEALTEARAAVDWVTSETATVTRADALATLAFIEFIRGEPVPPRSPRPLPSRRSRCRRARGPKARSTRRPG